MPQMPMALAPFWFEEGDDFLVGLADQDHLGDRHGFGVGDPQALAEFGLDRQPVEHRVDVRTAAMDQHRIDADDISAA